MEIRRAEPSDIPAIVQLLKESLGEGLMPKSETYWNWKHEHNPFGRSPVLLAQEGENIIGVRAFMCWSWLSNRQVIRAVRAVDTATHPAHQGKGIFSRLTKRLLEECKAEGIDLVFNTPNNKSLPGYLKMGWIEAGRLPITIRLSKPVGMALNILQAVQKQEELPEKFTTGLEYFLSHAGLGPLLSSWNDTQNENIVTAVSPGYLRWRYRDVPVARYAAGGVETGTELESLYFYRLKRGRAGIELRLTDTFFSKRADIARLKDHIMERAREHGAHYITVSGLSGVNLLRFPALTQGVGPMVTIRSVKRDDLSDFKEFRKWHPQIGDLELF